MKTLIGGAVAAVLGIIGLSVWWKPFLQLLAGAILAVDEHPPIGRCGHRDLFPQPHHDQAFADHHLTPVGIGTQCLILHLEPALPEGVAHHQDSLLE